MQAIGALCLWPAKRARACQLDTPEEIRKRPPPATPEIWERGRSICEYAKLRAAQDMDDAEPYSPGCILPKLDFGRLARRCADDIRRMTAAEYREAIETAKWLYGGGIVRSARPYVAELDALRRPGAAATGAGEEDDGRPACPLAAPLTPENERGRIIHDYIQIGQHIAVGARWERTDMPPLARLRADRAESIRAMTGEEFRGAIDAARLLYGGRFPPHAAYYLAAIDALRRPQAVG